MNKEEIQETPVWALYEKGRNFHRLRGIYTDTDINYRMYNGDQWGGAKLGDVEPVQKNFIKPIIRYKNGIILVKTLKIKHLGNMQNMYVKC